MKGRKREEVGRREGGKGGGGMGEEGTEKLLVRACAN